MDDKKLRHINERDDGICCDKSRGNNASASGSGIKIIPLPIVERCFHGQKI